MLQDKLERLTEDAAGQRERMEAAALAELKIMTEEIRSNVLRKEGEVNEVRRHIELLKSSRKQSSRDLRKAVKSYDSKRRALENKRKVEIEAIQEELRGLRDMCTELENNIEAQRVKTQAPGDEDYTYPLSSLKDLTIFHELEHISQTYHLKRR
jgi:t-SNARE complex subunit (syntaxin)